MPPDDPNAVASHCPNCKAEYRAGFDTCADCGLAVVPGPTPVEPEPPHRDAWTEATERAWTSVEDPEEAHPEAVELCRLPMDQAHLLAGQLREAGLNVEVADAGPPVGLWSLLPEFAWSTVWVRKDQLEEAGRIAKAVLGGAVQI